MKGDVGPYIEMDGPLVWVPRTVPYLEARRIAKESENMPWDRLVYRGKEDAELLGFARDCPCDERCEQRYREEDDLTYTEIDRTCVVPAWKFEWVER